MKPVYDVAVVGSRGFLGGAIARRLGVERVAAHSIDNPLVVAGRIAPESASARTIVWAVGSTTPARCEPSDVARDAAALDEALAAATLMARPVRLILLSSGGAIYGPPGVPPYPESQAPAPVNLYGESKRALEEAALASSLDVTVLRVANPFGPGQRGAGAQGVLIAWLRAARDDQPVVVFGDGAATRDYLYVDDFADAVASVVAAAAPPALLNVGSGIPTSLASLLDIVRDVVGPDHVRIERRPARGVDPADSFLDVSLARDALGWSASTPLDEGVARMWHWVRSGEGELT